MRAILSIRLQETKTQTTIVIAHRLTTILNADKIVVIDKVIAAILSVASQFNNFNRVTRLGSGR
jgi:ABC-type multidrug transport system fused ATPase/permease subunit